MSNATPKISGTVGAVAYSVTGQLSYVIAQMIVLAALTRFHGAEAVGAFGLAMAIATPVFLLANMGMRTGLATDVQRRFGFDSYLGLTLLTACLGVVGTVLIGRLLLTEPAAQGLLLVIALMKASESVSLLAYGAFQLVGRMERVALSLSLRGWSSALIFTLLLASGASVASAFMAQLVIWAAVAMLHDFPRASRLMTRHLTRPTFAVRPLFRLAQENAPLSISAFLNAVMNALPRLIIERVLGLEAVGIFTVAAYFLQAGVMVVEAVNQALLGRFAIWRQAPETADTRRIIIRLLIIATALSLAGLTLVYLGGEWLLVAGFGPEFGGAAPLLMLMALALCTKLYGIVPQVVLHSDRRFFLYMIYQAVSVVLTFSLLVILVPLYGLTGAGTTILAVAVFRLTFLAASYRREPSARTAKIDP